MISTKEKIASSFKELVGRKPFSKITIMDIARECGMTRENFYYHFHDKYDIVSWNFEKQITEKLAKIEGSFSDWFFMFLHYIHNDYAYYRRIFKVLDMTMLDKDIYQLLSDKIRLEIIRMYQEENTEKLSYNNEFLLDFYTESLKNWIVRYVLSHDRMDEAELMNHFRYLFHNILTR